MLVLQWIVKGGSDAIFVVDGDVSVNLVGVSGLADEKCDDVGGGGGNYQDCFRPLEQITQLYVDPPSNA